MKRRVLIVSPYFPPINAADHHRIRMSLPYFREFGWEPIILCVDPSFIEGITDPYLELTIPSDIEVLQSYAIPPQISRKVGLGNLAIRSIPFLINTVSKYLEKNSIDLVYFSNTVFLTMALGRYWLKKYKIPYILDFQDLWLSDYYDRTNNPPPGGKLKYKTSQLLARILEPFALKKVSHITSVSSEYPQILKQRYSWLQDQQFTILPFGAPENDFKILTSLNIKQKIFDPQDGYQHWVYVGRGGDDMKFSINALFVAIQRHRHQFCDLWQNIKIHFVGTKYSIFDNNREIEAIAKLYDIDDLVTEYPQRISYFEALQVLKDSHAILIIGSDDHRYSASKIYPCILAQKPILAILHQQSLVVDVINQCQSGLVANFNSNSTAVEVSDMVMQLIDKLLTSDSLPTTNWEMFEPYTAKKMTQILCNAFDKSVQ